MESYYLIASRKWGYLWISAFLIRNIFTEWWCSLGHLILHHSICFYALKTKFTYISYQNITWSWCCCICSWPPHDILSLEENYASSEIPYGSGWRESYESHVVDILKCDKLFCGKVTLHRYLNWALDSLFHYFNIFYSINSWVFELSLFKPIELSICLKYCEWFFKWMLGCWCVISQGEVWQTGIEFVVALKLYDNVLYWKRKLSEIG